MSLGTRLSVTALAAIEGAELGTSGNTAPMHAFSLRTGFGEPACAEAPRDGLLVQYDNSAELLEAIRGTLSGTIDGAQLARAAQEKVRQFSEERMLEGTIEVLHSL